MRAVVIYESFWGNTAAAARAIAEGIGGDTKALTTSEATSSALAGVDLVVVGAPVLAFGLPSEAIRSSLSSSQPGAPRPADLSHPSMRSWLAGVPPGNGRSVVFETRIRGPFPGGATKAIAKALEGKGYAAAARPCSFFVAGRYGPLATGELERALAWGEELGGAAATPAG